MMWIDEKYIGLLSSRLDRFKRVRTGTYNFRCPLCGDSTKNRAKARGYLFHKDKSSGFLFHCHNCGATRDFPKLLKELDTRLHDEYLKETLVEKYGDRKTEVQQFADKMKKPVFAKFGVLSKLQKVSSLKWDHPAVQYVKNRQIPNKYHYKLFYVPNFGEYMKSIGQDRYEKMEESRLLIPFFDENRKCFAFQGRDLSTESSLRYITIVLDESKPKIYGLDTCDFGEQHFILEGPIDSMFVNNSIAMAGGSIDWDFVNDNSVFVYDNEPRSKETCAKIQKAIDKGASVVIFPETLHEKDINDMVLAGHDIMSILKNNVASGLEAQLKLKIWRKIK